LDFSFSGLKTAILYFIRDEKLKNENFVEENLPDICASIQSRIVSILLNKLKKASRDYGIKEICIAGGVSANTELRNAFEKMGNEENWKIFIPAFEYCTDNAAMIAMTAYYKFLAGTFEDYSIVPSARTNIETWSK
jgi:N6-L-threonylcarbamoyladenine synthase